MNLAPYIEQTLLKPNCHRQQIDRLCSEAIEHQFRGVCVPPYYVSKATSAVSGRSNLLVVTVIGFPAGYSDTSAKIAEAKVALHQGADELDVVINGCAVKNGDWHFVINELKTLTAVVHGAGKIIKVIIEAGLLTSDELSRCCDICSETAVDFVKTSTGVFGSGATPAMIEALRKRLPDHIQIKASGGIRDRQSAFALVKAGANRIGTSSGPLLVEPVNIL